MYPLLFSFSKIRDITASDIFFFVSLVSYTGAKVSITCTCVRYFVTSASTRSLNLLKPVFSVYYVTMMCSMDVPFFLDHI